MSPHRNRFLFSLAVFGITVLAATGLMAAVIDVTQNVDTSTTWTADNEYILTTEIFITNGATLTIEPGTVVRGQQDVGGENPGALVATRGSKLRAIGTPMKPIVFTNMDDDNIGVNPGTPPYDQLDQAIGITGTWGGVILLGRGYVARGTDAGADPANENQIEGLDVGTLGLYGNCAADPNLFPDSCDDDDSGTMQYVSIRYGGFEVTAGNEINGLTLGAVGRETDLHHIEVFQNQDDGIEFFGGAAGIRNAIVALPGDDGIDYDEGWRGKIQFVFLLQGSPGDRVSDFGGEHDGGGSPDASLPFAIPTIYNATYIGLGAEKAFTNSLENTAIKFRDNAGGRYYNSLFADWGGAPFLIEGGSNTQTDPNTSGERAITPYAIDEFQTGPTSDFQLELQDNVFWCFGSGGSVPNGDATPNGGDSGKLHFDNGAFTNPDLDNTYIDCASPLPIRELSRLSIGDPTVPDPVISIDPRPVPGGPLTATDRMVPDDGFFEPAPYIGAFAPTSDGNWARGWTAMDRLGYFPDPPRITVDTDVDASTVWTSDNEYVLATEIFITNGATLTIEPGTVIRGQQDVGGENPGALVVTRGSKIRALGTPQAPIVFTNIDDDNVGFNVASAPYDRLDQAIGVTGTWGGVILLGRGYVARGTDAGADPANENQIEGLDVGTLGLYGNCAADPNLFPDNCDDDDSGTMQYVSIRYGGFEVTAGNEINGLTLGAVGRETDLHHIEVFQNQDDGIEFFGGAAGIRNAIVALPGDDGIDYDEGWRGKLQHVFLLQGTPGDRVSDFGGEHDGGGSPDASLPFAIPTIYNATYVGLGQKNYTNKRENTAIKFRDNAGGRYYNSFFADWGGAPYLIEGGSSTSTDPNTSGERATTPYSLDAFHIGPVSDYQLELQDNAFWCFGSGGIVPSGDATSYGGDSGKQHHDNGGFSDPELDNLYLDCAQPLPIRELNRASLPDPSVPNPVVCIDPRAAAGSPLLQTDRSAPADGFFEAAGYRGAFDGGTNWAIGWTAMDRLGYFCQCERGNPDAVPEDARFLKYMPDKETLVWRRPFGCQGFDLVRSEVSSDFLDPSARCLEANDFDTEASDPELPSDVGPNRVFFYLVRTRNACGNTMSGLGTGGNPRNTVTCQ